MKKLATLSALIALITLNASAQNLLVHYEFNNSDTGTTVASDSSGNGRDANITGWNGTSQVATALQTAVGVSGQAGDYAFDNTGAPGMGGFSNRGGAVRWVGTPDVDMINSLRALTISYWFKTPVGVTATGGARAVALYGGADNGNFFEQRYNTAGDPAADGFAQTVVTGSSLRTSGTAAYNQADTWTFAAFTFDGMAIADERIKMYVGDVDTGVSLVGTFNSGQTAINIADAVNSLTLGGYFSGSGQTPFQAVMDDFRLYGNAGSTSESALSLSELESIRAGAIPEPQAAALVVGLCAFLLGALRRGRRA